MRPTGRWAPSWRPDPPPAGWWRRGWRASRSRRRSRCGLASTRTLHRGRRQAGSVFRGGVGRGRQRTRLGDGVGLVLTDGQRHVLAVGARAGGSAVRGWRLGARLPRRRDVAGGGSDDRDDAPGCATDRPPLPRRGLGVAVVVAVGGGAVATPRDVVEPRGPPSDVGGDGVGGRGRGSGSAAPRSAAPRCAAPRPVGPVARRTGRRPSPLPPVRSGWRSPRSGSCRAAWTRTSRHRRRR